MIKEPRKTSFYNRTLTSQRARNSGFIENDRILRRKPLSSIFQSRQMVVGNAFRNEMDVVPSSGAKRYRVTAMSRKTRTR